MRQNSAVKIHPFLFAVVLASSSFFAANANSAALPTRDLNPFIAGYEIPASLPSEVDGTHHTRINVDYNISNISLNQQYGIESATADAETHRWQFTITHAISSHWSIQVELPYQSVSGGSLDAFIENFHHTFGLPNGNRSSWPHNRLLIDYSVNHQSLFHLEDNESGLADISMRAGWHFDSHATHSTTLWFTAKLPTGNANQLTGSGSFDSAVTLSASQRMSDQWHAYEQASLSCLGNGKRLQNQQKSTVLSGMAGLGWSMTSSIDIDAQLNWHSALYDSNIRMLGPATQLSIGPRYGKLNWQAWLAITEDIAADTAPDVQFQFALAHQF